MAAAASLPGRCTIDTVFSVPGVGTVVAGTVLGGTIHAGATMLLGPSSTGEFTPVIVRSIEVNYVPFASAAPGISAAFAIRPRGKPFSGKRSWIRKGLHLVDPRLSPTAVWAFSAESLVLHHSTTVQVGYAPQCHISVTSQSAVITHIARVTQGAGAGAPSAGAAVEPPSDVLRTGDRAIITFRCVKHPAFWIMRCACAADLMAPLP